VSRRPETARRAARDVAIAISLVFAVVIVGANFVLVEVRLPGLTFEARLGWVILVALALGFGAGALWMRRAH